MNVIYGVIFYLINMYLYIMILIIKKSVYEFIVERKDNPEPSDLLLKYLRGDKLKRILNE